MEFFITKYALTKGIIRAEGEECGEGGGIKVKWRGAYGGTAVFYGKDWHRTREAAELRALGMQIAKIGSLREQLAKVEKMRFTKDEVVDA